MLLVRFRGIEMAHAPPLRKEGRKDEIRYGSRTHGTSADRQAVLSEKASATGPEVAIFQNPSSSVGPEQETAEAFFAIRCYASTRPHPLYHATFLFPTRR
jgi:hypothetical protein